MFLKVHFNVIDVSLKFQVNLIWLSHPNDSLNLNSLYVEWIVTNWRMANTKVIIIFQNFYATPLIRLLLRVIRSLVTTYQIYEILYSNQLEDGEYKDDIHISNLLCHAFN